MYCLGRQASAACCSYQVVRSGPRCSRQVGCRLPPSRATNEKYEVWRDAGEENLDPEVGEVQKNIQWPERFQGPGPIRRKMLRTMNEEMKSEGFKVEDVEYFFNPPPEGWLPEVETVYYDEELEPEWADARHYGPGRTALEDVEEGQILEGTVTDMWLYHGAEIDIGAQFDGLVVISEENWERIPESEMLWPETKLKVRVHKVRSPGTLFRWPIQLTIVEPTGLQELLDNPDTWQCPVDHRGWDPETIAQLSGRELPQNTMLMEMPVEEQAFQKRMAAGFDDDDVIEEAEWADPEEMFYFDNDEARANLGDIVGKL